MLKRVFAEMRKAQGGRRRNAKGCPPEEAPPFPSLLPAAFRIPTSLRFALNHCVTGTCAPELWKLPLLSATFRNSTTGAPQEPDSRRHRHAEHQDKATEPQDHRP